MILSPLYFRIKNDSVFAIKNDKKKHEFLKFIISEFDRKAYAQTDFTDKQAIKVLEELKATAISNKKSFKDISIDETDYEISILDEYIPQVDIISTEELTVIIKNIIKEQGFSNMSDIKKILAIVAESCHFNPSDAVAIIKDSFSSK